MHSVTTQQILVIRSIVSEVRQTLSGSNPIKAIGLNEIADNLYSLDAITWNPTSPEEENHVNLALQTLQNRIIAKGIPCKLDTDRNTHTCQYNAEPENQTEP